MITKNMYAKHVINEFVRNRNIDMTDQGYSSLNKYVKDNPGLGIALDQLNCLDEDNKKHIENRNGTAYVICYDKLSIYTLTTREIMDMLPDDI